MKSYFFTHFILLVFLTIVMAVIFVSRGTLSDVIAIQSNKTFINVPPLKIDIDSAQRKTEEVPFLFRIGVWLQNKAEHNYIISKFFAENQAGKIQMDIGTELLGSNDFEDYKKALEKKYSGDSVYRKIIEEIKKSRQTLIIGHWPSKMPKWLTSRIDEREFGGGNLIFADSPPKCYEKKCNKRQIICYDKGCEEKTNEQLKTDGYVVGWAGIIDYDVRFFKEKLGVSNLGYYVGHEQNKDWIGKEENFFKVYEYTYRTVKEIDKKIIVGGAGPWHPFGKRVACDPTHYNALGLQLCEKIEGWAIDGEQCKNPQTAEQDESCEPTNLNLLQYARQKGLGVDFINYHHFKALPQSYDEIVSTIRHWLQSAGFNKDTPLYPADWTFWGESYPADYIDTEQNAAYVISALYHMNKAGIQWHSHDFNVAGGKLEEGVTKERGESAQFIGDWPIFTRDQIIKPVYNAFRMLSIFNGVNEKQTPKMRKVSVPQDDYVAVLASQTLNQKINRILVVNFIPSDKMARNLMLRDLGGCFLDKDYNEEKLKIIISVILDAIKANKNFSIETINGINFSVDDKKIKTDIIDCLKQISPKIQELKYLSQNPRQISLSINNLPSGKYLIKKYLIDEEHSNSCRYNQQTAPDKSTPCGIGGEIDKKVESAKKEAQSQGKNAVLNYLKQIGYSDSDIESIEGMARSCKLKISCISQLLDKDYLTLDRCKSKKKAGRPISQKCSSSDIVKIELKEAVNIYKETRDQAFYRTSPNSIDKINNQKGVALETIEQKQMTIKSINFNNYEETIKLNPNAVMLIEITKN